MKLGFIGIGQMGRHMSRRLVEAGHDVTIYDVNRAAAGEVLAKGAAWADSPKAVAEASDIVVSSLPTRCTASSGSSSAVRATDEVMSANTTVTSRCSPWTSERIR